MIRFRLGNTDGADSPLLEGVIEPIDSSLVGMSEREYSEFMQSQTAVKKGFDFIHEGIRYQIRANRPSGKPGSFVTMAPKAKNYDWDVLICILYNKYFEIQEAWVKRGPGK